MNQYLFLRRLRGPIMLLVFGITAILDEYTNIHYGRSWPLYIIAWGLLKLAENAILAQNPPPGPGTYPGYPPQPGAPYEAYGGVQPTNPTEPSSTAIVPVQSEERR